MRSNQETKGGNLRKICVHLSLQNLRETLSHSKMRLISPVWGRDFANYASDTDAEKLQWFRKIKCHISTMLASVLERFATPSSVLRVQLRSWQDVHGNARSSCARVRVCVCVCAWSFKTARCRGKSTGQSTTFHLWELQLSIRNSTQRVWLIRKWCQRKGR